MVNSILNEYPNKRAVGKWRPQFHFTAPFAWMNDPNGLIYFKGWYHLFYQYNPKQCEWGAMHWGHAVSKDMFHWRDMPIALRPDQPYDKHMEGGCFSGSAVEKDGGLYLFYSATVKVDGITRQTQCLVTSEDGIHFEKYKNNPIISTPPQGNSEDFRDPKVFKENGKWYMVLGGSIGGADCAGDGRIFLYESPDLYQWSFCGNVLESNGKLGTMFECPDMFQLNGKWILTCSPMNHPNYNKALYCVGNMDFENCRYEIEKIGNLDYGFDYYAPQSFLDVNGNRVLMAWQNGWPWMPWCKDWGPTKNENWRGSLSVPRKASLEDDLSLCLYPVHEFGELVENKTINKDVRIAEEQYFISPENPKCFYLRLKIDTEKVDSRFIEIGVLGNGNKVTSLNLDLIGKVVTLDKEQADQFNGGKINCLLDIKKTVIEFDILVDYSSIEVYINKGRYCITTNVYPEQGQTECWIRTPYKAAVIDEIEVGTIKSVWE